MTLTNGVSLFMVIVKGKRYIFSPKVYTKYKMPSQSETGRSALVKTDVVIFPQIQVKERTDLFLKVIFNYRTQHKLHEGTAEVNSFTCSSGLIMDKIFTCYFRGFRRILHLSSIYLNLKKENNIFMSNQKQIKMPLLSCMPGQNK